MSSYNILLILDDIFPSDVTNLILNYTFNKVNIIQHNSVIQQIDNIFPYDLANIVLDYTFNIIDLMKQFCLTNDEKRMNKYKFAFDDYIYNKCLKWSCKITQISRNKNGCNMNNIKIINLIIKYRNSSL